MGRYCFLVMTNAVQGRDDEFNKWYDNQHLPDVLDVPGIVAAQRFRLDNFQMPGQESQHRYMAIYEIETNNPKAVFDDLASRTGTDKMVITDTLDMSKVAAFLFTPIGPRVTAQELASSRRRAAG